jgi:hypothetical protein
VSENHHGNWNTQSLVLGLWSETHSTTEVTVCEKVRMCNEMTATDRQADDFISPLSFFESKLKTVSAFVGNSMFSLMK